MDQQLFQASADNLSPALFQCFTIILCGYVAGRMNIVSQTESKGLATFVGTFALPSLIFLSLAQLNFAQVNWTFLLAILLAKGLVFLSVILVTLSVTKPPCLSRAGLFAIFCTQSNDFALGYPIISSIYSDSHPEYASYLYLMAPISLAILNPVSFVLMEVGKQRSANATSELLPKNKCEKVKMLWKIVKGIAYNPILVMTVLGIIGNFVFKHDLPIYISGLLKVLGDSFSAAALFLLGLRMVGQFHRLKGPALILPAVFLIVKLLVLPIIMREFVSGLSAGSNASETLTLSTYAFLYGTIPTAPAVFVFSNNYQLEVDLMASSMVLCTFVSAPLMFVSAKMIVITKDFADQLQKFGFDLSIFAAIASVWVIIVFSMTKKYKRIPHRVTLCLVATQLVLAISVIWGRFVPNDFPSWQKVFQQSFLLFSMYSCRLWTAMLAIALLFLQSRGPCFVVTIWPVLCFVSWGVPAVIISVLLVMKGHTKNLNGKISDAIRLCVVVFCLTVASGALLIYIRYRRRNSQYNTLSAEVAGGSGENGNLQSNTSINGNEATLLIDNQEETSHSNSLSPNGGCYGAIASPSPSQSPSTCCTNNANCNNSTPQRSAVDIEDVIAQNDCACPPSVASKCTSNKNADEPCPYLDTLDQAANTLGLTPLEQSSGNGGQLLKHSVLIMAYTASMFVEIGFTAWTIVLDEVTGIYVELEFLDITVTYGQSLILWVLFGLDPNEIFVPVIRFFKKLWYGADTLKLIPVEDLSFETKHVCEQFMTHHLERCRQTIAKDARWRMKTYHGVFRGSCLVNWLINCGLAKDEMEAVQYGRHLVEGRLIAHINNAYHFRNSPLLDDTSVVKLVVFEEIISEIQNKPEIWLSSHSLYKKRIVKAKVWRELAIKVGIEEDILKKRWKLLKDQHRKELKKAPPLRSGSESDPWESTWQYFNIMSFVKDEVIPAPSTGNLNTNTMESTLKTENIETHSPEIMGSASSLPSQPVPSPVGSSASQISSSSRKRTNIRDDMLNIEKKKLLLMEARLKDSQEEEKLKNDEDFLFLKSILPSMKKLRRLAIRSFNRK